MKTLCHMAKNSAPRTAATKLVLQIQPQCKLITVEYKTKKKHPQPKNTPTHTPKLFSGKKKN